MRHQQIQKIESSTIENVFEAIIDAVSEMITEIFAEIRTEDSESEQDKTSSDVTDESKRLIQSAITAALQQ